MNRSQELPLFAVWGHPRGLPFLKRKTECFMQQRRTANQQSAGNAAESTRCHVQGLGRPLHGFPYNSIHQHCFPSAPFSFHIHNLGSAALAILDLLSKSKDPICNGMLLWPEVFHFELAAEGASHGLPSLPPLMVELHLAWIYMNRHMKTDLLHREVHVQHILLDVQQCQVARLIRRVALVDKVFGHLLTVRVKKLFGIAQLIMAAHNGKEAAEATGARHLGCFVHGCIPNGVTL
mmetsp:Transcript_28962/g.50263  ORF Transcript_28962/g.50263 Transcript_28962/m.50263 type:complete len:235 (-) Transcript_28962:994-1698(-)